MNPNFENFIKGDYITVLQGQRLSDMVLSIFGSSGIQEGPRYDNSYKGDVLEVMATDYPYLVLKNKSERNTIITLDCRMTVFKKLSDEFVKASLNPTTDKE